MDFTVHAFRDHLDPTASRRELDGVGNKVPDYLLETLGIAADGPHRGIERALELDSPGIRRGTADLEGRRDHRVQIDGANLESQLAEDDPRDIKQIIHQLRLRSCTTFDRRESALSLRLVEYALLQHPHPGEDGGKW